VDVSSGTSTVVASPPLSGGALQKLAGNHQNQLGERASLVRERKENEDGFEFWLYYFDLSNNLAEFLS